MKIVFLLPGISPRPAGGFKVVYEYANRLVARGHRVRVVHPWVQHEPTALRGKLEAELRARWLDGRPDRFLPWFSLDDRVSARVVPYAREEHLVDGDAIVATAWETADLVADTAAGSGRGFYLIQGYETWGGVERVRETWRLPLRKLAVSGWLQQLADEMGEGERTRRVPNGVDLEAFGVDFPPERRSARVGALLSAQKGADTAPALELAREREPELEAATFGTVERPPELPQWVEYVRLPRESALRRLYNSCSIFLQASTSEGWGLPATEAMACGCALITYDNGGSREYAVDGDTAVVVARRGPAALADAIVALSRDRERRLAIASAGRARVERLSWDDSAAALERALIAEPVGGSAP